MYIHMSCLKYMSTQIPSILTHMSVYTCMSSLRPTQQHSARYSVMANLDACVAQVLSFVLHHAAPQCLTSREERDARGQKRPLELRSWGWSEGACEQCWDAWALTKTSTSMFAAVEQNAKSEQLTRSKPYATSEVAACEQHAKDEQRLLGR